MIPTPTEAGTPESRVDAFSQLQLAEPLSRAIAAMRYPPMTPIQAKAIPAVPPLMAWV